MIYFDNAATTFPKPDGIAEAVCRCMNEYCGNPGRGSHQLALRAAEKIYDCRSEIADLLGEPDPTRIIFVPNATIALNLAIKSKVKTGDHILISDQEHNAVLRPVMHLAKRGIASYSVYLTMGDLEDNIRRKLKPESTILICNVVSNINGRRIPIDPILKVAKETGLYLIADLSQWIGHSVLPRNILEFDALCAPGHKALFGMQGSGFLRLRSGDGLDTLVEGGSGNDSKNPEMPHDLPERFEAGTVATPAIVSLLEGVRYVRQTGCEVIEEKEDRLTRRACEMLTSLPGITVWSREDCGGSVLSFAHHRLSPGIIADRLDQANIFVRSGFHCAPLAHKSTETDPRGTVRISFSVLNSMEQLEEFYQVLRNLLFLNG